MHTAVNTALPSGSCLVRSPFTQRLCPSTSSGHRSRVQAENRRDTGYMKEDSAGQENIFAVESKSFVAGSAKDTNSNSVANAAVAGVAIAVAAVAIGAGVLLTKDKVSVSPSKLIEEAPKESLSSISKRIGPAVKRAVEETPAAPAVKQAIEEGPAALSE